MTNSVPTKRVRKPQKKRLWKRPPFFTRDTLSWLNTSRIIRVIRSWWQSQRSSDFPWRYTGSRFQKPQTMIPTAAKLRIYMGSTTPWPMFQYISRVASIT